MTRKLASTVKELHPLVVVFDECHEMFERVKADTIEGLYAQLRRCRDHCRGQKFIQHRTANTKITKENG